MNITGQIHKSVEQLFRNYQYKLHNSYVFAWESDFFAISKSEYTIEVEIKISKQDFNHDFQKSVYNIPKHDYLNDSEKLKKPNKFYFAMPKGLIEHREININYGIIEYENGFAKVARNAKFLHKDNLLKNNWFLLQLVKKFYYRNIDLRQAMNVRDYDLKYGQKSLFDYRYY